ncbi:hypothetical protein H2248_004399 [Termitomyces sp. 'cryptogamus']|nr:hypothetical protein H2248_004399 [Termitomyces sp. 'cryptogamus']
MDTGSNVSRYLAIIKSIVSSIQESLAVPKIFGKLLQTPPIPPQFSVSPSRSYLRSSAVSMKIETTGIQGDLPSPTEFEEEPLLQTHL